jgi:N-acetylglucosaminyl-diphospho-decaprenol L-rhamnosyltransferase
MGAVSIMSHGEIKVSPIPNVGIVIVNWNAGHHLAECLRSIHDHGGGHVARVVVVDNGSTDGSLDDLGGLAQDFDIVRAGENLGFGRACNLGAKRCLDLDYILFLNPDARLTANSLAPCVRFMESIEGETTGIVGARLLGETGETQRHCARFPSWRTILGQATGLSRIAPSLLPPHLMSDFDHLESREVDQVIGAFFLVRSRLFEAMGGFDERFFVYFEEVDFAHRAKARGWRTYYLADAVGFHRGQGSSEKVKAHRLFYSLRSRLQYAFKHFSRTEAWCVVAITFTVELVARAARGLMHGSYAEFRDVARAYRMLLFHTTRHRGLGS